MYDEKFRHYNASSPTTPWGQLGTETYLFCIMKNSTYVPSPTTPNRPSALLYTLCNAKGTAGNTNAQPPAQNPAVPLNTNVKIVKDKLS